MSFSNAEPTQVMRLHFLIIGGGLAGISAAIALTKKGHVATVLEAGKTFSEVSFHQTLPSHIPRFIHIYQGRCFILLLADVWISSVQGFRLHPTLLKY